MKVTKTKSTVSRTVYEWKWTEIIWALIRLRESPEFSSIMSLSDGSSVRWSWEYGDDTQSLRVIAIAEIETQKEDNP